MEGEEIKVGENISASNEKGIGQQEQAVAGQEKFKS